MNEKTLLRFSPLFIVIETLLVLSITPGLVVGLGVLVGLVMLVLELLSLFVPPIAWVVVGVGVADLALLVGVVFPLETVGVGNPEGVGLN